MYSPHSCKFNFFIIFDGTAIPVVRHGFIILQSTRLLVQGLLASLAVLLGTLLCRKVLGNHRSRMSVVSGELGVGGLLVSDGLDGELLLALWDG